MTKHEEGNRRAEQKYMGYKTVTLHVMKYCSLYIVHGEKGERFYNEGQSFISALKFPMNCLDCAKIG